jgi:hypothetical protein
MDPPKTRRECKKDPKQKRTSVYSQRHIRLLLENMAKKSKKS